MSHYVVTVSLTEIGEITAVLLYLLFTVALCLLIRSGGRKRDKDGK